jgi:hypothetical protein
LTAGAASRRASGLASKSCSDKSTIVLQAHNPNLE